MSVTVHPVFIGNVPKWHNEGYTFAPAVVVEDRPIQPLLLAVILASPLLCAALLTSILL
jgi:hypothetical protein